MPRGAARRSAPTAYDLRETPERHARLAKETSQLVIEWLLRPDCLPNSTDALENSRCPSAENPSRFVDTRLWLEL